jgi:hypothetical protein
MKIFFLLAAFIFTQTTLYSQSPVIARWTIISAFDGDVYINSKTDSFSMSEQFKKLFGDSLSMAKKLFRTTYLDNHFEFKADGVYHIYPAEYPKITGTYVVNNNDSTILLNRTDSANRGEFDPKFFLSEAKKLKYFFTKSLLHLYLEFEERHVEFVLEQESK